jgi:hypothetical protein
MKSASSLKPGVRPPEEPCIANGRGRQIELEGSPPRPAPLRYGGLRGAGSRSQRCRRVTFQLCANSDIATWLQHINYADRLLWNMSAAPDVRLSPGKQTWIGNWRVSEKCHIETHAPQQDLCDRTQAVRGSFETGCQASSSSSNALASLRSSVSKPSVNQA